VLINSTASWCKKDCTAGAQVVERRLSPAVSPACKIGGLLWKLKSFIFLQLFLTAVF
jgi:hypothetical protein